MPRRSTGYNSSEAALGDVTCLDKFVGLLDGCDQDVPKGVPSWSGLAPGIGKVRLGATSELVTLVVQVEALGAFSAAT